MSLTDILTLIDPYLLKEWYVIQIESIEFCAILTTLYTENHFASNRPIIFQTIIQLGIFCQNIISVKALLIVLHCIVRLLYCKQT